MSDPKRVITARKTSMPLTAWDSLPHKHASPIEVTRQQQSTFYGNNAPTENVLDTRVAFRGQGRVAQALRWVSSAALSQSAPGSQPDKKLTEIQSTMIGGRLLMGSNAKDDSYVLGGLQSVLQGAPQRRIKPQARRPKPDVQEQHRVEVQRHRHSQQLSEFVNNDAFFGDFLHNAIAEHENIIGDSSWMQTAGMLVNLRKSLKDVQQHGGASTMAGMAPNVGDDSMQHAEQRIIDHVQGNREQFLRASRKARFGDETRAKSVDMVLAGTKPPCEQCHETEQQRAALINSVAGAKPAGINLVRYETMRGALFPIAKTTPSRQGPVTDGVAQSLAKPTLGTGVSLTHAVGDSQKSAITRRDSGIFEIPSLTSPPSGQNFKIGRE